MKTPSHRDYERMKAALLFLVDHYTSHPTLGEVAEQVRLSSFHFQRIFQEWVGVTPKQFVQYLSVEHAKKILRETQATLSEVTHEVGFSGTSRLHDLFIRMEGMTPGEYKNGGSTLVIHYSFADTPFGGVLVASTSQGICHLSFADDGSENALERLKRIFPHAAYVPFQDAYQQNALSVFRQDWNNLPTIKLHLKGTDFQLKIWETLLKIPFGGLTTYTELASRSGYKGAQRAVGSALRNNPVMFLIPCHRVIQATGILGSYRYGEIRKNVMIGWEAAKKEQTK